MTADPRAPLGVIVLTLDEAPNIAKAVQSVGSRAPVIVIDSGSTDGTQEIARRAGAEVIDNDFVDYASQRNFGLELTRDRFRWIFFLDADEEIPVPLWDEILAEIERDANDGAYVGLTMVMLGRELRHGAFGAAALLRMMRPELARFVRDTNERVDDRNLRVTKLRHRLRHDDRKALPTWFRKHVRYAEREARLYVTGEDHRKGLAGFSPATKGGRAIGIRWAYNKLPLFVRPFLNFGRAVFVQSAWRDGIPGLMFASMHSLWYPMMIDLFIYEHQKHLREADAQDQPE